MKYNIIANDCIGARCYEFLNLPFGNPFMWNRIYVDDFYNLIKNFSQLNFNNFTLSSNIIDGKETFFIFIDSKIKIYYTHYIKNNNYDVPTKQMRDEDDVNILYKNIENYIIEKYTTRLKRMDLKQEPIFILNDKSNLTIDKIKEFIDLNTNYKIILNLQRKKYIQLVDYCKGHNNIILIDAKTTKTKQTADFLVNEFKVFK